MYYHPAIKKAFVPNRSSAIFSARILFISPSLRRRLSTSLAVCDTHFPIAKQRSNGSAHCGGSRETNVGPKERRVSERNGLAVPPYKASEPDGSNVPSLRIELSGNSPTRAVYTRFATRLFLGDRAAWR